MDSELKDAVSEDFPDEVDIDVDIDIDLEWPDRADIERVRSELKLKGHLLKQELKDQWRELEKEWQRVQEELNPVKRAAAEPARKAKAKALRVAAGLRKRFERLHSALKAKAQC